MALEFFQNSVMSHKILTGEVSFCWILPLIFFQSEFFQELLSEFIGIPLTKEAGFAYYIIKGYLGIQLFTLNIRLVGSVSRDALNKQG